MIKAFDVELPPSENGRPKNKGALKDIKDFLKSKYIVAEIEVKEGKNVNSVRKTYNQIASKNGLSDNLIVSVRQGRLFLIKTPCGADMREERNNG